MRSRRAADFTEARAQKVLALAKLLHRYGESKLAMRYLMRLGTANISAATLIEEGNLYAEEKHWIEARQCYEAAWANDHRSAAAMYLWGWVQTKRGEEAEGRKRMEVALMMPLGDGQSRRELSRAIARLDQDEEAARQRQLVLRLAPIHDVSIVQVLDEMCDAAGKDTHDAAFLSQRLAAEFLLTDSVFLVEARNLLPCRVLAHSAAARELLRAGKRAEAIEELHRAEAIQPENVQLPLDCDALLRTQGAAAEADALYRRMYDRLEADCRAFPRWATAHNDLAWLAANMDRDLDRALRTPNGRWSLSLIRPAYSTRWPRSTSAAATAPRRCACPNAASKWTVKENITRRSLIASRSRSHARQCDSSARTAIPRRQGTFPADQSGYAAREDVAR